MICYEVITGLLLVAYIMISCDWWRGGYIQPTLVTHVYDNNHPGLMDNHSQNQYCGYVQGYMHKAYKIHSKTTSVDLFSIFSSTCVVI